MVRIRPRFNGEMYRRSKEAIAHGALTNSKRPESFIKGVYPTHLSHGLGCRVWDTEGNEYVDFISGLGSNLIGYAHPDISEAIYQQSKQGINLSLGTELEVKCAERIKEFFPFVERVRFLKTGSEACTAATIIARNHAKSWAIASDGYHGWHPEFTSLTKPANGVTEHPWVCKLGHPEAQMGAIIVEPVVTDISDERRQYLNTLRASCTKNEAVLIFDEVISGFRFPHFSVAQDWAITPDLICLGKALAGGLPLSIVAGKKDIMEGDYFVSSTFAGETLALAACLKMMDLLQNKFRIDYLWEKGAQFLFRFNEIWRDGVTIEGYPTRGVFKGDDLTKALFMQECCRAGILVGPSFFFTFPHIEIMDEILSVFADILNRIRRGEVALVGEMPRKPYAQKVRDE